MRNLVRTGDIAEVQFCYHDLPEKLDLYDYDAFNRSKTEFYAVCSNVETGKPEYIRITDMKNQIDVIRASASLPYVSRLVKTEGMKLLDGGCTDSIPLMKFREMGFTKNVVILTRPKGYQKEPEQLAMAKSVTGNIRPFWRRCLTGMSAITRVCGRLKSWRKWVRFLCCVRMSRSRSGGWSVARRNCSRCMTSEGGMRS